ncbi:MAG: CDGSH iron-sulfur domain-containing protein [Planctomycetia bacterium]|nr:CDGSH iron-sulfur domain-containing protein [Planctomycetia bacterium]
MSEPLTIRCRENGPLVVKPPVRVVDHLGNEFPLPTGKELIALCRCGRSGTKPFCDGAHRQAGFQAAARATPPGE